MSLATAILAAGLGTRMKSERAKVLHPVAGRPMIEYAVQLARSLGSQRTVCILGHQADAVRATVEARFGADSIEVALQPEQRGTGHALLQAEPLLGAHDGLLLVLYGDTPLLTESVLRRIVEQASASTVTLMTARLEQPTGYGRILRDDAGRFVGIVEERDASPEQRKLQEINAGIYCGPAALFFATLQRVGSDNAQGEIYLTDVLTEAARAMKVVTIEATAEEMLGCNDRIDLARADRIMRRRLAEALMRSGVSVRDPEQLYVEPGVEVGRDTTIGPGVELRGRVTIGRGCTIGQGSVIVDCTIGDGVHIKPYCVLTESSIGDGAQVGPFCHVRPGTEVGTEAHLGNFVELKKTKMGAGSKANHLSYLGDAEIGAKVNVGCGTITCNYDGYKKYRTVIEDEVHIGSDTQLVAPVTVGRGAVTGAGTTVYRDVPPGALAITRPELVFVEGWAERKRRKMQGLPPLESKEKPVGKKGARAKTKKATTKHHAAKLRKGGKAKPRRN